MFVVTLSVAKVAKVAGFMKCEGIRFTPELNLDLFWW